MSTELFECLVHEVDGPVVTVTVALVYSGFRHLPRDPAFFLRTFWSAGREQKDCPLRREISIKQGCDEDYINRYASRFIEEVEILSATNYPIEDMKAWQAMFVDGALPPHDKLPQRRYRVRVRDPRWVSHLHDVTFWGTTSYDTKSHPPVFGRVCAAAPITVHEAAARAAARGHDPDQVRDVLSAIADPVELEVALELPRGVLSRAVLSRLGLVVPEQPLLCAPLGGGRFALTVSGAQAPTVDGVRRWTWDEPVPMEALNLFPSPAWLPDFDQARTLDPFPGGGEAGRLDCMAFSEDGKRVLLGSEASEPVLLEVGSFAEVHRGPRGSQLFYRIDDYYLPGLFKEHPRYEEQLLPEAVYDAEGEPIDEGLINDLYSQYRALSPDGRYAAVVGNGQERAMAWRCDDLSIPPLHVQQDKGETPYLGTAAALYGGRFYLGRGKRVQVWDVDQRSHVADWPALEWVWQVEADPLGRSVVAGCVHQVGVHRPSDGLVVFGITLRETHGEFSGPIQFSADGRWLLIGVTTHLLVVPA